MSFVHHTVNYFEFSAQDLKPVKLFYAHVFGWAIQEWGDQYISFQGAGIDGGIAKSDEAPIAGGALVIVFSEDLEASKVAVTENGGTLTQDIYSFPGGRRFHFADPAGNHLAIWTNRDENGSEIQL